jgi:hypothetical protein
MTDAERTARLEGILEAWNRVMDRHEEEMRELRRQGDTLNAKMDRLIEQVAKMRGWIIGAVVVMGFFTAINAVVG